MSPALSNLSQRKSFYILLFVILESSILFVPNFKTEFHEWRQSDVAAMARNFALESPDILRPRVDIRRNLTGIGGSEFPFYPYTVSLIYRLTNTTWEGYAKILSILSGCGIMLLLMFLGKNIFFLDIRSIGIACFLCNIFLAMSRMVMPENFGLFFCLLGISLLVLDIKNPSKTKWLFTAVAFSIGICSRPFLVSLGLPILAKVIMDYRYTKKINYRYTLLGSLVLIPFFWWYLYWVPYLKETYGLNYFFSGSYKNLEGLENIAWIKVIKAYINSYLSFSLHGYYGPIASSSYIGLVALPLFYMGLFFSKPLKKNILLVSIFLITLVSIPLVSHEHCVVHPYYLYALAPITIILIAQGISSQLKRRPRVIYLLFILITIQVVSHIKEEQKNEHWKKIYQFQNEVDARSNPNDLFLIEGDPAHLYAINRKGWATQHGKLPEDIARVLDLKKRGCKWIVFSENNQLKMYSIDRWINQLKSRNSPNKTEFKD